MRRPTQTGFALLELVVSTLILFLVLMISVDLLAESQTSLVLVNRAAHDSMPEHALTLLRRDVMAARSFRDSRTPGGLLLAPAVAGAGSVVYLKSGDRLERITGDGSRRLLMTGVESFDWWEAGARLLEVQITFVHRAPLAAQGPLNSVASLRQNPRRRTARVRISLRGTGARRW